MSFSDIEHHIEKCYIDPLNSFRQKTAPLNQIHNDSLTKLSNDIAALMTGSDGQTAFQGSGARALDDIVNKFVKNERSITGSGTDPLGSDLSGRLLDICQTNEKLAKGLQDALYAISSHKQDDNSSTQLAAVWSPVGVLGVGAAAQGGADIPWDIIAAIGAVVAGTISIGILINKLFDNPDQDKSMLANLLIQAAAQVIEKEYQRVETQYPLPTVSPSPQKPDGDDSQFLKALGITAGVVGGGVTVYLLWSTLSGDQKQKQIEKIKQDLEQQKVNCSEADIEQLINKIIDKYGDLTTDQIERIIKDILMWSRLLRLWEEITAAGYTGNVDKLASTIRNAFGIDPRVKSVNVNDPANWPTDVNQWPNDKQRDEFLQNTINGMCAQYQVAQYLKGDNIEVPVDDYFTGRGTTGGSYDVDIVKGNEWIEVKNYEKPITSLPRGKFNDLVDQTWRYILDGFKHRPPVVDITLALVKGVDPNFDYKMPDGTTLYGEDALRQAILDRIAKFYKADISREGIDLSKINFQVIKTPVSAICDPHGNWCQ